MDTPISNEMIVLYGNPHDPMVLEAAKKLEDQGRYVEVRHPQKLLFLPNDNSHLKSEEEIQRAHDTLWSLVTGEIAIASTRGTIQAAHCALDVLCWILNHDHNKSFQANLDEIQREAERRGFVLTSKPA